MILVLRLMQEGGTMEESLVGHMSQMTLLAPRMKKYEFISNSASHNSKQIDHKQKHLSWGNVLLNTKNIINS